MLGYIKNFNPRSREGSDGFDQRRDSKGANFNPRSREGSDAIACCVMPFDSRISIHAPAKGATRQSARCLDISNDFNPRSREGSDGYHRFPGRHADHFNPRSREGSDRIGIAYAFFPAYFNPRSREGSDGLFVSLPDTFSQFQSTLPRRERLEREKNKVKDNEISIHAPAKGATAR